MSDRRLALTDSDLDRMLAEWLGDRPEAPPDRIAEAAILQVATTPQESAWLQRFVAWGTSAPGVLATTVLLALAIGLGVLVLPRVVGDSRPSPTPTVVPEATATPDEPSPEPSATTITPTSFGDIVWTRVETANGITPWTELDGLIVGRSDAGYFVSTDGITWEPATVDVPVEGEIVAGDGVVLSAVSSGGPSVMMGPISYRQVLSRTWEGPRADPQVFQRIGSDWVEQALPPLELSAPSGLAVRGTRLGNGGALGPDSWVVPALTFAEIPWSERYGAGEKPWPMWNETDQVLDILPPGTPSGDPIASLRVELTRGADPAIRFVDASDGTLVREVPATLPGWTGEELLAALRGWGLEDISLIVRIGGETRLVRPPWPMGEEWSGDIVTARGRYYTVSVPVLPDYSATAVHLWESEDGVTWRQVALPAVWEGRLERADLYGGPDGLLMAVQVMDGGAVSVWSSPDGETWSRADISPSYVWYASATPFGWVLQPDFTSIALSADGITWESVPYPGGSGEPMVAYLAERLFIGPLTDAEGSGSGVWVGQLRTE
jgi:hypothetical protein